MSSSILVVHGLRLREGESKEFFEVPWEGDRRSALEVLQGWVKLNRATVVFSDQLGVSCYIAHKGFLVKKPENHGVRVAVEIDGTEPYLRILGLVAPLVEPNPVGRGGLGPARPVRQEIIDQRLAEVSQSLRSIFCD